eukprot:SAG31_NODE_4818_length_2933_cov_2.232886_2_plen_326_part_00
MSSVASENDTNARTIVTALLIVAALWALTKKKTPRIRVTRSDGQRRQVLIPAPLGRFTSLLDLKHTIRTQAGEPLPIHLFDVRMQNDGSAVNCDAVATFLRNGDAVRVDEIPVVPPPQHRIRVTLSDGQRRQVLIPAPPGHFTSLLDLKHTIRTQAGEPLPIHLFDVWRLNDGSAVNSDAGAAALRNGDAVRVVADYEEVQIDDDGHCMYNAFLEGLWRQGLANITVDDARQQVIAELRSRSCRTRDQEEALRRAEAGVFVDTVGVDGWGDHVTLGVLAHIYSVRVIVHEEQNRGHEWIQIGADGASITEVVLKNEDNIHFKLLV